jgi:hypothetical protein
MTPTISRRAHLTPRPKFDQIGTGLPHTTQHDPKLPGGFDPSQVFRKRLPSF